MKKLLFICVLAVFAVQSKAQVYFQNTGDYPLYVCFAYYSNSSDFKGWVSKGHYKVEPGERKQILDFLPSNSNLYYHAKSQDGNWVLTGDYSFLIDPVNAFTIRNADKQYQQDNNPSYKWKKFNEVSLNMIQSLGFHYTIKDGIFEEVGD